MSHNAPDTDAFTAAIRVPDLGDQTYPADAQAGLEGLASRTKWLANTLGGAAGTTIGLSDIAPVAGATVTGPGDNVIAVPISARAFGIFSMAYNLLAKIGFVRLHVWGATGSNNFMCVPIDPVVESDGASTYQAPGAGSGSPFWTLNATSNKIGWYQAAIPTAAPELYWYVRGLPPAGRIISFSVNIKGSPAHAGLPGTMPTIALFKRAYGGAITQIAIVGDTSASTTDYQAEHSLTVTDLIEPIAENTSYFFRMRGEAGANKQTLLALYDCVIAIGS